MKSWDAADGKKGRSDPVKLAANYLTTDLCRLMKEKELSFSDLLVTPENFAELVNMINKGAVSSRAGKDILEIMVEGGGDPSVIAEERGLKQESGASEMGALAEKIIRDNPAAAEEYGKGKDAALQFLVGKGMKETRGAANPSLLAEELKSRLGR